MTDIIISLLISPRFKSFYWRAGGFIVVGFIGLIVNSLDVFHLSATTITFTALVLNEITKLVNDAVTIHSEE